MHTYIHKVHYYETDKMGITHHSNYIRWMEEARMDLLDHIGYGMKKLEDGGITSPVVSVECQYKHPTVFGDDIKIAVSFEHYTGVRFSMRYTMTNADGTVVLTAASSHCFINADGQPVAVKKYFPELDAILKKETANCGSGAKSERKSTTAHIGSSV